jgi:hypothetical protein
MSRRGGTPTSSAKKGDTVGSLIIHDAIRPENAMPRSRAFTPTREQLQTQKARGQQDSAPFPGTTSPVDKKIYERSFAGIIVDKSKVRARPILQNTQESIKSSSRKHREEYCSLFK